MPSLRIASTGASIASARIRRTPCGSCRFGSAIFRPTTGAIRTSASSASRASASSTASAVSRRSRSSENSVQPSQSEARKTIEHLRGALARVGGDLLAAGLQVGGGDAGGVDRVAGGDEGGQRAKLFLALDGRSARSGARTGRRRTRGPSSSATSKGICSPPATRALSRTAASAASRFSASLRRKSRTSPASAPRLGAPAPARRLAASGDWTFVLDAGRDGLGVLGQPAHAVAAHVLDQRHQRLALLGERVLDPRRHLGEGVAGDDALRFQRPQAQRERARADPLERALQLAEAARALGQVADDQEGPLAADDVGGATDGTAWSCLLRSSALGEVGSKNLASGSVAP